MNQSKKKWLFIIGACCIALVLGAFATAFVFSKLNFPSAWIITCIYICYVGAGGVGVIIAAYVHSIPHQDKYHGKRLEVMAWKDLGTQFYGWIVGVVSIYMIIQKDNSQRNLVVVALAIVIGVWIPVGQLIMKKRLLKGLDERERLICERAKAISDSFFTGFCLMGLLGLWGWVGLKASVPVYIPVIIVFGLGAIAEILKPLIILIQCKMEKSDEPEGGAA
jgi:MFS family permease